jgi:glutamyl-tRNA reductase
MKRTFINKRIEIVCFGDGVIVEKIAKMLISEGYKEIYKKNRKA